MASETLSEEVAGNVCDWCQGICDPAVQELNALTCSFTECPETSMSYHQTCLEKYLKSIKLDKGRKTGFACPRGCGAKTCYDKPCPGRVLKSHPIHVVNEEGKKRRKAAQVAHAGDQTPKFGPAAKAAKAAAAEQLRREKEFKIARDAEKRRKDEEKMATAARQRQADKDAS